MSLKSNYLEEKIISLLVKVLPYGIWRKELVPWAWWESAPEPALAVSASLRKGMELLPRLVAGRGEGA